MTRNELYLLLATAMVAVGLLCVGGVLLEQRLSRPVRRLLLTGCAAVFLVLLPLPFAAIWPLSLLALLGLGVLGGSAIGRSLASPDAVIAFLVVVSVIDVISFRGGPTAWIIEGYRTGTSELLLHLAVTFPVRGRMVPLVGVGDLVIMSALIEATRRFGYPTPEVVAALAVALVSALAVGLAAGGIYFLPFVAATMTPYLLLRRRWPVRAA
jgi:hypothetical protein